MRHNNQLPNEHFRKDWQRRVKTWFNQPGKKVRRRKLRAEKAAKVAPRPVDGLLRPVVRCPTFRYNMKSRAGRGFTLEELKEAGIRRKEARTIGIAVDFRRRNRSVESLQLNVERLKAYKARLLVFPRKNKSPKKADTPLEELSKVETVNAVSQALPISRVSDVVSEVRAIEPAEKEFNAYATLRKANSDAKLVGIRAKRAQEKEEAKAAKAK